jgi:MYXO-CTERM domain-containing protein
MDDFDFYPTPSSLVRDAADPNGNAYIPEEDFNGTARDGESPDVGAYEYDGDGNPGWVVQETFKEYTPREGNNSTDYGGGCCGKKTENADGSTALVLLPLGLGVLVRRRRQSR